MFTKEPRYSVGKKKDKLTILRKEKLDGIWYWWCQCDCGNKKFIRYTNFYQIKSCGCSIKDRPNLFKHGLSRTRFYHIFAMMKQRCNNPNSDAYFRYGKRGIRVLWESLEEFKNDMYLSYIKHCVEFGEKETSLDRIDNDGDYCKENCRWATHKEQANNTKANIRIRQMPGLHLKVAFIALAIGAPISFEEKILNLIHKLPPKQAKILDLRFNQFKTLGAIAEEFGYCKERVRQLQNIALKKLIPLILDSAP